MDHTELIFDFLEGGKPLMDGWYDDYFKKMRMPWEEAVKTGRVPEEELAFFDSEAFGNQCPICRRVPNRIETSISEKNGEVMPLKYYEMDCSCYEEFYKKRAEERSILKRLRDVGIPEEFKEMRWRDVDENLVPDLQESLQKVKHFSYGEGLQNLIGRGAILYGEVGRGKTLFSFLMIRSIIENTALKCKYFPMSDFIALIFENQEDTRFDRELLSYDVLFMDDLDKLAATSPWVQERVFSIFDSFFKAKKTILITTNLETVPEIQDHFGKPGQAIVSRMVERLYFIGFFGGRDYRIYKRKMELKKT